MSNTEDLCYCPACIITRKGFYSDGRVLECLRDKKGVGEKKDEGQQTRLL